MDPMHKTFDSILSDVKSIENVINNTRATNDWSSKRERMDLNHALKNQLVEELINVIIANGVIRIKTFKTMYRSEYVNNREIRLIVIKLFKIPSIENTLIAVVLSLVITLSSLRINSEKLILQPKIFSPSSRIASEIKELIFINCSIKKNEELDKIAKIKSLKIN